MTFATAEPETRSPGYGRRLAPFLLLSVLLHVLTVDELHRRWAQRPPAATPPPAPLEVRVARPPVADEPARQIVDAPPVANERRPAEGFAGVRDQSVPQETVAPELGPAENLAPAAPSLPEEAPPAPSAEAAPKQGTELAKLLLDPYQVPAKPGAAPSRQQNAVDRPAGPITLLNTKSHPFSEYLIDRGYRALRLWSMNVELSSWYVGDVRGLRFPAVVVVVVDEHGEIVGDGVETTSGSRKVDHILLTALRGALRGHAPPAEALVGGRVEVVMALDAQVMRIGIR